MVSAPIKIRDWAVIDLGLYHELRNNWPLRRLLMATPRQETREDVLEWLLKRTSQPTFEFKTIALTENDRPVGYIQAAEINIHSGTANLGVCLSPEAQGKGWGFLACGLFHRHLLENFGLSKIRLLVRHDNVPAISLYRRLGYRQTETISGYYFDASKWHDAIAMEIQLSP